MVTKLYRDVVKVNVYVLTIRFHGGLAMGFLTDSIASRKLGHNNYEWV